MISITEDPISITLTDGDEVTVVQATPDITIEMAEVGVPGPAGPVHELLTFSMMDHLQVATGTSRIYLDGPATLHSVIASLGTADDADVVVDVLRNGVSVFANVGSQPTIPTGDLVSPITQSFVTSTLAAGDYLTVNVDQVGTTGKDLTVSVRLGAITPFGTTPTISGSRGGNAALASLLTALDGLGLINDSTTT